MIEFFKKLGRGLACVLILPVWILYLVATLVRPKDETFSGFSQFLSLVPGRTGSYLRVAFYRLTLDACDPTAFIEFGVLFSKTGARIGRDVYIGPYSQLGWVTLEEDVLIGSSVQVPSGPRSHGFDELEIPIRQQHGELRRITIGHDSWIGSGSIILAHIASQSIVGAGSVVTKAFPARSVIAGNPGILKQTRGDETVA